MDLTQGLFAGTTLIALFCQYLSISIGVGYGTILTPLLLVLGFSPLQIIPVVLFSQVIGGIIGGLAHHRAGNIMLDFRRDDKLIKKIFNESGFHVGIVRKQGFAWKYIYIYGTKVKNI